MFWMKLFIGVFTIGSSFAENCEKLGTLLYEDLGCTPIYSNSSNCPMVYKCSDLNASNDKCHFKGKSYKPNETLPDTGTPCINRCSCYQGDNNTLSIQCMLWACDDVFMYKPDCPFTHSFEDCCATGIICPPFENLETCVLEGKKYHEGEKFQPSEKCFDCICQKGFRGKIEEPFCKRQVCGIQLETDTELKNYCAPFYGTIYKRNVLCCPEDWICSDGTEVPTGTARSGKLCRFGNKNVKIGESIEKKNYTLNRWGIHIDKIKCECALPPLLTCKEHKSNENIDNVSV